MSHATKKETYIFDQLFLLQQCSLIIILDDDLGLNSARIKRHLHLKPNPLTDIVPFLSILVVVIIVVHQQLCSITNLFSKWGRVWKKKDRKRTSCDH